MNWYKKSQNFNLEIPVEESIKKLKVLVFGVPGTPIQELGQAISDYYDIDLFELSREYEDEWTDKIPAKLLDTGDKLHGSESNRPGRDPGSDSKRRAIDRFLNIPNQQPDPISYEDKIKLYGIPDGVMVTEVAEPTLIHWINKGNGVVFFLDVDEEMAVTWLKGRRKCLTCDNTHHKQDIVPKFDGICDRCGSDLIHRPEDQPANVRHQYNVWRQDFTEFKNTLKKSDFIKIDMTDKDFGMIEKEVFLRLNERFMS
ncbi:MAG: hypothetical protein ACW99A_23575 [Candidatus Kariarchaeaceae archaeon]|jgi:adenylate kinase family enzyme